MINFWLRIELGDRLFSLFPKPKKSVVKVDIHVCPHQLAYVFFGFYEVRIKISEKRFQPKIFDVVTVNSHALVATGITQLTQRLVQSQKITFLKPERFYILLSDRNVSVPCELKLVLKIHLSRVVIENS